MNGTHSILEASVPSASTSGLRLSAYLVAAGRRIRIGTRSNVTSGSKLHNAAKVETTMRISKSKFMAWTQCLKRLYWQVHEPEPATELDDSSEARIEQGRKVGLLARQLFQGGVEVDGSRGLDEG